MLDHSMAGDPCWQLMHGTGRWSAKAGLTARKVLERWTVLLGRSVGVGWGWLPLRGRERERERERE